MNALKGREGALPEYRLYRLNADNHVDEPSVDINVADDAEAVLAAFRIDHAAVIEVWNGKRLVTRVYPGGKAGGS